MSDDGDRTCPLCAEEMDITDQQLKPCKCGYDVSSYPILHYPMNQTARLPLCPPPPVTNCHLPNPSCMQRCRFVSGAGTTSLIWLRKRRQRAAALHAARSTTR